MHDDPFAVLGVSPEAGDDEIRRRYLELVREHPPEREPERFAAVRAAYEKVRTLDSRVRYRLFELGKHESIEGVVEEIACRTPRPRLGLQALLTAATGR
jgi:DnaJ-class molecular chaperone